MGTVRRLLNCGSFGLRTVNARESFEFTEDTTDVVSRWRCLILISPLFCFLRSLLCFAILNSVVFSYGAGRRRAYTHKLVDCSALVPNFARSLSRTFTGVLPGSLIIVVVGDDLVTKDPGFSTSYRPASCHVISFISE